MNYNDIMQKLQEVGTEQTTRIYRNHGADLDLYGVSMAELKKIAKKVKTNHEIGIALLNSKNVDAIYLARWIVDPFKISIQELEKILLETEYYMLIENAIPYIAGSNKDLAFECIEKWISSEQFTFRQAAYSLYSYMVTSIPNKELNVNEIKQILLYIEENIHNEQNRVRYAMNNFLIAVGGSIPELTTLAKNVAEKIGEVHVLMGKTACKVPYAPDYIKKIKKMGKIGVKRKIT